MILITVRISNRSHTELATIRQFAANQLEIMSEYRGPLPPERTCGTECVERASVHQGEKWPRQRMGQQALRRRVAALAGVKIVDLTRVLGGPFATQLLADHGADVIKLEPPMGDEVRDWGPPFHDGDASYYIGINRNKRSIGLDLAQPTGRDVLLRLLEGADALIENFKPGSMEAWGIGYEASNT